MLFRYCNKIETVSKLHYMLLFRTQYHSIFTFQTSILGLVTSRRYFSIQEFPWSIILQPGFDNRCLENPIIFVNLVHMLHEQEIEPW